MKINVLFLILNFITFSCVENYNGEKAYLSKCANCHGIDGKGLKQLIPTIKDSDYLIAHRNDLACIIRNGIQDTIVVNGILFHGKMPGNKDLNETDIVNLINYIHKKWYPDFSFIAPVDVKRDLSKCAN